MARENVLLSLRVRSSRRDRPDAAIRMKYQMAERLVLVGLIPQTVVLDPGDQVSWISDAGNLRVEFDVNRCPFSSNIFQAPARSEERRVGKEGRCRCWRSDEK